MTAAPRTTTGLRETLLDAATELLAARGYRGLRMAEVAAGAGVSRQTVYNEFGDKEGLAQAALLHCTAGFLTAIDAAMGDANAAEPALRSGARVALEHAEADPLIVALVTGGRSGAATDLLAFLADRHAEPVLRAATDTVAGHLERLRSDTPPSTIGTVATAVVRLAISHMLLPTSPPSAAAVEIADLGTAVLVSTTE